MTVFWCEWCGETAQGATSDDHVPCRRCALEFSALIGFVPRTEMIPLREGESPGEPVSARRQFVFRDRRSGRVRYTRVAPATDDALGEGA